RFGLGRTDEAPAALDRGTRSPARRLRRDELALPGLPEAPVPHPADPVSRLRLAHRGGIRASEAPPGLGPGDRIPGSSLAAETHEPGFGRARRENECLAASPAEPRGRQYQPGRRAPRLAPRAKRFQGGRARGTGAVLDEPRPRPIARALPGSAAGGRRPQHGADAAGALARRPPAASAPPPP